MKIFLHKRDTFNYRNDILSPISIESKQIIIDRVELDNKKIEEKGQIYNLDSDVIRQIKIVFFETQPNI